MKKIKIVSAFLSIMMLLGTTFSCNEDMDLLKNDPIQITPSDTLPSDTTASDSIIHKDSVVVPTPGPVAGVEYAFPNETGVLKTFIKGHPRLMLTKNRLEVLKANYNSDPLFRQYVDQVLRNAKSNLSSANPAYVSGRLLDIGWNAYYALSNLGFAYLWTGDNTYAAKAKSIMLSLSSFPNWYPQSFIDASTIAISVAIGLDWCYDYLDKTSRETISKALINKLLIPGKTGSWQTANSNWNAICSSAVILSSLSIAEYDKTYAQTTLEKSVRSLQIPITEFNYGPWHEGTIYGNISLNLISCAYSSILTALNNNDLGLRTFGKDLYNAADFYAASHNRNNMTFNYSDILERSKRQVAPNAFFFGSIYNKDYLIANEQEYLKKSSPNAFHVVWYKKVSIPASQFSTNKFFGGTIPTVFYMNDTYGNNSIYLAIKGGENGREHGHLDLGNFEMDALGVRWVRDLGYDNYNLPGMFDMKESGKRWTYYRVSSLSHNVPVINNSNQDFDGKATLIKPKTVEEGNMKNLNYSVFDLSKGYKRYVKSLLRGVKLIDNNRSILFQDEYSLLSTQECYWGITTDATITILDPKNAKLTLNGKIMYAKILSENCSFSVLSAAQKAPQNPNNGVSRLIAKRNKDTNLNFTIAVMLSPEFNGYHTTNESITTLSNW